MRSGRRSASNMQWNWKPKAPGTSMPLRFRRRHPAQTRGRPHRAPRELEQGPRQRVLRNPGGGRPRRKRAKGMQHGVNAIWRSFRLALIFLLAGNSYAQPAPPAISYDNQVAGELPEVEIDNKLG